MIIGTVMMLFVIYAQNWFDHALDPIPQYQNTIFLVFDRIAFAFGMMFIIYPAILGFCRPLFYFISAPLFNILGKITYGTYMFHYIIIFYIGGIMRNGYKYEYFHMFIDTVSLYFLSYICSFVLSALFESPVIQLLRLLNQKPQNKQINPIK